MLNAAEQEELRKLQAEREKMGQPMTRREEELLRKAQQP
jgi:hypothetical protein